MKLNFMTPKDGEFDVRFEMVVRALWEIASDAYAEKGDCPPTIALVTGEGEVGLMPIPPFMLAPPLKEFLFEEIVPKALSHFDARVAGFICESWSLSNETVMEGDIVDGEYVGPPVHEHPNRVELITITLARDDMFTVVGFAKITRHPLSGEVTIGDWEAHDSIDGLVADGLRRGLIGEMSPAMRAEFERHLVEELGVDLDAVRAAFDAGDYEEVERLRQETVDMIGDAGKDTVRNIVERMEQIRNFERSGFSPN